VERSGKGRDTIHNEKENITDHRQLENGRNILRTGEGGLIRAKVGRGEELDLTLELGKGGDSWI